MSLLPINLDHLLRHRSVETSRVEYKGTWDDKVTGEQVLKTICAFANDFQNLNGGYVVLGVTEQDGLPVLPPRGLDPTRMDALQKAIRGLCNRLDPAYQPVVSPEVFEDRHLLVLWCPGSETRPHQAPRSLEKGPAPREFYIRLGSETVKAQGELLTQLLQLTARVPFDDRRAPGIGLEELRESRVREFLADIESDLLREPSTPTVLRRMRVTARTNGHEVPKNVGLLFFSDDPEQWFPGARIEVAQFADDSSGNVIEERVFRGPIHEQLRSALRYLETLSTRHLEKVRNQPEVRGWVSYPEDALEEALVNAVYHRGYDGPPEPTKVYLYPDRLEVVSYPGPVPGLELEHFETNRIPPTPARNRRIGELLKELRLAEGRGTGIPKVFRAMKQNGSPAPRFDFDPGRSYFRVTLPAHPEYFAISALRDAAHLRAVGASADAQARLQRAFEELPSPTLATELIGELGRSGDLDAARAVYERIPAALDDPAMTRPTMALAEAYLNAQKEDEAKPLLARLGGLLAPEQLIDAAILERRVDRQEEAHRLFERAGDLVRRDVRALHEFAQTKVRLADRTRIQGLPHGDETARRLLGEAEQMLDRVLQMDAPPTRHAWASFDLARVQGRLGAPVSERRHALERARALVPSEERFVQALRDLPES